MAPATGRDEGKERQWRKRLARQAASGLSIAAWCRRNGLSAVVFHYWKRRLLGKGERAPVGEGRRRRLIAPRFAEVLLAADRSRALPLMDAGGVEIVLDAARVVRVAPGFDGRTLAAVLDVLEGRAC